MKSNDEFLRELNMVHDGRIISLERYIGRKEKILFKCNECGNEWKTTPGNILKTKNCPECSLKLKADARRLTHVEFIKNAKEKMGDTFYNYEILGKYKDMKLKMQVKHKECGYEWSIKPGNFYRLKTCPKCHGRVDGKVSEKRKKLSMKTNNEFKKELEVVFGNDYTPLEEYKGYNHKVLVRHEICGHEWSVRAGTLLKGHGCPKCAGNYKRTTRDFIKELEEKYNGKLKLISEFINVKSDVTIQCNECGEIFTRNANYIINDIKAVGCPSCSPTSRGEEIVRNYLRNQNIFYITEYTVEINKQKLRFDFAIYNKDEIIAFIEYNGIQHYNAIAYFGGEEALESQKQRDELKKRYCIINNIALIEIPYTIEEVEKYLDQEINKLIYKTQLALIM